MPEQSPAGDLPPEAPGRQLLKLLVELGPLVVFFVVNWRADIFWGTGAFMVATAVSLVASRLLFHKIPLMPLVSGAFVLIFGALTLWLQSEVFIKMKPTIVNTLFGSALGVGLALNVSLLRYLFADSFHLTDEGWRKLTRRWMLFFFLLAIVNEAVWRNFSTDFWISFKIWGVMPLTLVFGLSQLGLIKHYSVNSSTAGR